MHFSIFALIDFIHMQNTWFFRDSNVKKPKKTPD